MSDGREERAEQEARREWERQDRELQEQARRNRAAEYVPAGGERDWEPERDDS